MDSMGRDARENYLKNAWNRYSSFPADFEFGGRVLSLQRKDRFTEAFYLTVEIHRSPSVSSRQSQQLHFVFAESEMAFPANVLREGDWIALKCEAASIQSETPVIREIQLLAPRQNHPLRVFSNEDLQKSWQKYLSEIRQFFGTRNFLEIATPSLVMSPGTEPFLDVFQFEDFYLPTSPELHLKKALSAGYSRIFEIRSCFRRGEISDRHQPEFTMLEWYRSIANLQDIKQDTIELIGYLHKVFFHKAISQKTHLASQVQIPALPEFREITMQELFAEILQFHLTPMTSLAELKSLAARWGLHSSLQKYEIWDDVFFQIYVEKIEPVLEQKSHQQAIFLTKYPPSQAALARLTEDGWGDRWELYWQGMELANAFHELNDPEIQRQRFAEDLRMKIASGRETVALDTDFLQALEAGMPPSAGIALGVERLFLCFNSGLKIQDLRLFPYLNQVREDSRKA